MVQPFAISIQHKILSITILFSFQLLKSLSKFKYGENTFEFDFQKANMPLKTSFHVQKSADKFDAENIASKSPPFDKTLLVKSVRTDINHHTCTYI